MGPMCTQWSYLLITINDIDTFAELDLCGEGTVRFIDTL